MKKTIFKTDKKETFKSKLIRLGFNFFPAYRRTGARIYFLSDDWRDIHITLGLNWKTKNYVGSVFGGSIYGALDPMYMMQLINILGKDYVVWDKSASIKFLKPIKKNVYARFLITNEILTEIIAKVKSDQKYSIDLATNFQDENGIIYAEVTKTIYIADKEYYKTRKVTDNK
jgi:acyl-coenzyme A thioesterase PaaI-like protein